MSNKQRIFAAIAVLALIMLLVPLAAGHIWLREDPKNVMAFAFVVALAAGLGCASIMLAIQKWVFEPLRELRQQLESLTLDSTRKLSVEAPTGDGDIAVLSQTINLTLTKVQQANIAIEAARKQYQRVIDGLTDCVLVVKDRTIVFANKIAADRLANGDRNALNGLPPEDLFDQESQKVWKRTLENTSETTALGSSIRLTLRDAADKGTVQLKAAPVMYDGGAAVQIILTDISMLLEEEESQMQRDRLKSVGELAGGIAHDFNNLLTVMMGAFSMVTMCREIPDDLKPAITRGEDACEKARQLADQLLVFAKDQPHQRQLLNLEKILQETIATALAGSNIRGELEILDMPGLIKGDPDRVKQLFHNILINARQAMQNAGVVSVTISSLEMNELEETSDLPAGLYAQVEIMDQGCGIPEDLVPRVFDPYVTTKQDCSGLGLSVAYAIAQRHQGVIQIDSVEGEGTKVTVFLPVNSKSKDGLSPKSSKPMPAEATSNIPLPKATNLAESHDAASPQGKQDMSVVEQEKNQARSSGKLSLNSSRRSSDSIPATGDRATLEYLQEVAKPGHGQRILIMDDDEPVRRMIGNLLERSGYTPILVERGEAAIEQYKAALDEGDPFSLVILDLTIVDGMGGRDTLMQLKKLDPRVNAMVCSGYSNDPVMANPLAFGFRGRVRKPYRINELISKVQDLIPTAEKQS